MKRVVRAADVGARQAWLWRNRFNFGEVVHGDRPRLLVDVSAILRHDAQTGIQRVVRAVWSELRTRSGDDLLVVPVFATNTHGYCYAPVDFLEQRRGGSSLEAVRVRPGDKFLGLDLSAHLLPNYRRQLKAWRSFGATVHLVVYDLLPLERPEWFSRAASGHFKRWLEVLLNDADQAICISEQVARSLRSRLAATSSYGRLSIGRLRMGSDIDATIPTQGTCGEVRQLLERIRFRPAILMVGTVEPRKGYDAAISAFEHLWNTRPNEAPDLVIIGKGGWKTEALQNYLLSHPERGKRLHWLDSVTDEGLCLFYEGCRGVFMASRGEGFGLPLIEAALHRRHVLARDLAVFREQGISGAMYFTDDRPEALGESLMSLNRAGQDWSLPKAELPTWSECVEGLLSEIGLGKRIARHQELGLRKAS
jgi:glycosyltransferase involved in cell wall biosynthesis